jgi:predicted dehydrogenase
MGAQTASRILVIGAGRMGAIRAEDLVPIVDEVLIANRTALRAENLAERLGASTFPFERLVQAQVDGYVLTTATGSHAGLFEALIATGRPMLIEKPLALGLAESQRMARLAARGPGRRSWSASSDASIPRSPPANDSSPTGRSARSTACTWWPTITCPARRSS